MIRFGEHAPGEKRVYILLAILILAGFAVYSNSLKNGFVYDDRLVVSENHWIEDLGNIKGIFSGEYFAHSGEATYRPVVTISYFLDNLLWGKAPWGFHLTNVMLHLLNVTLVFFLTRALFGGAWQALMAASIFAFHPVLTEPVNCVGFREDLLCMVFFLGGWLLFRRSLIGQGQSRHRDLAFGMLLYILALFSKETAIVLPGVLLLDALLLYRSEEKRNISKVVAFMVPILLFSLVFVVAKLTVISGPAKGMHIIKGPKEAVCTIPILIHHYLRLMLMPSGLRAVYDPSFVAGHLSMETVLSIGVILSSIGVAYYLRKREPRVTFALGYFFITIFPVIHVIFSFWVLLAERFLYLPILSFCWLAAIGAEYLCGLKLNRPKTLGKQTAVATLALLSVYAFMTHNRNEVWRDSLALWSDAVIKAPRSSVARNNLGLEYKRLGMLDAAMRQYRAALASDPEDPDVMNNMGNVWLQRKEIERAKEAYYEALRRNPCMRNPITMLVYLNMKDGDYLNAARMIGRFQECFPGDSEPYRMRGLMAYLRGDRESSRASLLRFLQAGGDPESKPVITPLLRRLGISRSIESHP